MTRIIVPYPIQPESSELAHLPPLLQRIYQARGVQHAQELDYQLSHLLPWNALSGIQQAAELLAEAIAAERHIMIIGDFDADGATSCALSLLALRAFGATRVDYLVPNRFTMGYGLTPEIVAMAKEQGAELLMTVDNGIASHAGVEAAHALGLPVIITDHHLSAATLPTAAAIVNPNQPGDTFPSKNLCGVGVAFYVMLALRAHLVAQNKFTEKQSPNMAQYLDLVALGTVADVVPLDHNNRLLVQQGLQRIRKGQARPGIMALLKVAGKNLTKLTATDVGYAIAPRLNAAGRLEDMRLGIECLLTDDLDLAQRIAQELNDLNQQRKHIEQEMRDEAEVLLKEAAWDQHNIPAGVSLYVETWHQGVIGILASRVKEQVHRPVICFAEESVDIIKGSARSIPGVHIRDVLDLISKQHPELIIKFGGHAMAAGLSIPKKNFTQFQTVFAHAVQQVVTPEILTNMLYSDGEISDFTLELAECLQAAGPWGQHFPEPLFNGKFKVQQVNILNEKHIRFTLQTGQQNIEAILFFADKAFLNHNFTEIDIAYRLNINEFRDVKRLQLIIEQLNA
jgi:single-stranded-DNA-specific exonuclease